MNTSEKWSLRVSLRVKPSPCVHFSKSPSESWPQHLTAFSEGPFKRLKGRSRHGSVVNVSD